MHRPWVALALSSLVASSTAKQLFENTAVVRSIELGGSMVHVTTAYAIKALEDSDGSDIYTIGLPKDQRSKTSWIQVKLKGASEALPLTDSGCSNESGTCLFDVKLPKSLKNGDSLNLLLETVETNVTVPYPRFAGQTEDQSLKYFTNLYVVSPYKTAAQRTKMRSSSPRIISYTTPEKVDKFTLDNPVTKSGATLTYGPFNNVEPSIDATFSSEVQQPIQVHYVHGQHVIDIVRYERAAEISHWGANLNIQDEVWMHNAGPGLKGHFSRLNHQLQQVQRNFPAHVISGFAVQLPPGISNVYYYDVIGNISTSALRPAPRPLKGAVGNVKQTVLELKPRYPIMGGWNTSFTLGWDSPLADSVSYDAKTGNYIAAIPVMTQYPGAIVRNATINIVLPEGSTDVQYYTPSEPDSSSVWIHTSYLDTRGRPTVKLQYNLLTDKHNGIIYVTYKVPFSAHLLKPVAVSAAILLLFVVGFGGRRFDSRLSKKKSQ